MTILNSISSPTGRRLATTTVLLGTIGFLCGFLLSLALSAYSLYACIAVL
jgi:hypothetical protein